jgi:hypothetical protein
MCTMTWLRRADGYHVFFNRDERLTRGSARAPALRRAGERSFIAPLDADFGGSWIAVNDAGVTLALQNAYLQEEDRAREPAGGYTSRGLLVTSLVDAASGEAARQELLSRSLHVHRGFLLTIFEPDGRARTALWNGAELRFEQLDRLAIPLVSSSFDGDDVRARRSELYRRMEQESHADPIERHLAYHASHLPARGAYSPCMHRPDAETVSFSWIRVTPQRVEFRYSPRSPCLGLPEGEPLRMSRQAAPK